ncbi:hypothetical protein GCM10009789_78830 [Kribbella sancticallisti]|uniref:4-amino-4-deoxy-L-arabinose transferase n=1 Tax=Kribbella sancticallisti TaxID=460087 RepID=A0ABN2EQ28_9ACTN
MTGIWGAPNRLRAAPDDRVLRVVVLAVAAVQSVVLGLLARRGSWLSDDLDFLVQGDRGFAPNELLTPLNDHIAPGLRFVYAVFAQLAPLSYDFTVGWRVVMQALAIALMGFLLLRLLGSSWWVVTGTALYALTPLSMPSFMSLSSAVNNLPAHVFGLLLLHATLDWYSGHRRRAVAYGPLSVLISLACWEKSGLVLITALALALYLRKLPLRPWLRQSRPFAAALAVPVIAFGVVYLTHGRPTERDFPSFGQLVELAGHAVAVPVGALVGGPWQWSTVAVPFGLADAPAGAVVLGAGVAVFLLLVAWRMDRRALWLWGSVIVYVLVTLILVSYARFEVFGAVFVLHYHYWSDLSIALTLAVVLSARSARPRVSLARLAPAVAGACLVAWIVGIVVSDVGFAKLWGKNPAGPYFATVTGELEAAGPTVNLWDVTMPGQISTTLATDNRLSPVLRMAGIPFELQGPGSAPRFVDDSGRLRPAELVTWSTATPPPNCGLTLRGVASATLPLKSSLSDEARWFAKIGYVSSTETRLRVELVDADGRSAPMPEPAAAWPAAALGTMYYGPSDLIRATSVRVSTTDPSATVCLGGIDIGLPGVTG